MNLAVGTLVQERLRKMAEFLAFQGRATQSSGAALIHWLDECVKAAGAPKNKQRILGDNEDDCRATLVVLDGSQEFA